MVTVSGQVLMTLQDLLTTCHTRIQNSSKTDLLLSLSGRSFRRLVDMSGKAIYLPPKDSFRLGLYSHTAERKLCSSVHLC